MVAAPPAPPAHPPTRPIYPPRPSTRSHLPQLFPLIDANKDGVLSVGELQHHLYVSGLAIAHRRAQAEFTEADTNHDGAAG